MKAWVVHELGDPQQALQLDEVETPTPGPGEVLVQVEAAAANFFDILLCQGKYQERPPLPFTPGAEVAGAVIAVGEGAACSVGQRVMAMPKLPRGGFCEVVSVPASAVYPIPDELPWTQAAGMYITYQTAYYALHHCAKLQPGEVLLVHAGAGGVGSAAIQLGKAAGARVIATAGGPEKLQVCRDVGADVTIDYRTENFADIVKEETRGRGADVIFDPVGGDVFDRSRKCIAFGGRLLVIGFAGGRIADAPTNHILLKNYAVVGVHWGLYNKLMPQGVHEIHQQLMQLYLDGKVKPLIYQEFPLVDLPQALELLGTRKTWGKVILRP
ncbi:NADPH:quinone oxidoreductase family protein [Alicyclobacillus cycloheptanicus]|uniref:NADPH2:quinone reductase n=1 Tax=Alicyclobacillus cycloheptanicus TaxID=1457 RepID=A0ABT9XFR9_9BACL|nr:NADPH:quinone oxidoreductase family protein [Alicyclobacillus cycloheptanicus]MDQ0189146.1 NADPH2:quinone reductase [Alicyclobacillus cycloheptanicus]WDM00341.1 NADPH:quinone oxidoreductase family protein [Alicyclobacillus cycloheptanicus]